MAFGQGTTGLIVALIVALSSGAAFIICFREFVREILSREQPQFTGSRFTKSLRKNRNVLLDDGGGYVVADDIFDELLKRRNEVSGSRREWRDPISYLMTVAFLGIVAAAGFIAGLSHFA